MMPANIVLKNLAPPPRYGEIAPLVDTDSFFRDGFRGDYSLEVPHLAFTDLISGPATGLGDGLGSGAIVTIWCWGAGDATGTVWYTDSLGVERSGYVYYWKKADGTAPSGPANLWASHAMYEIAFSIPAGSADGAGSIRINKQGVTVLELGQASDNVLPFTVRAGRIFHTAPTGNNANAGTWSSPKAFINGNVNPSASTAFGNGNLIAGDIVYSRGVAEPVFTAGGVGTGMYLRSLMGTLSEQIALVEQESRTASISAYESYQRMLEAGVAREVARIVLPLNIYSSMYVTMNSRALMNFLSLRTKREGTHFPSFPQREIEMCAEKMEDFWAKLMPYTYETFNQNGRVAP
jgi:hypothetical protein